MESITLQPSEKQIQDFVAQYQEQLVSSKNPYIRYLFKLDKATASIYTSGKILFQGEKAEQAAQFFGYQSSREETTVPQQNCPLIGTDEVGNGSYFGGLAIVASFVTPEQHRFLRKLGVDDSKSLTDQKIRQIVPLLKEKIQHQALLLSPKKSTKSLLLAIMQSLSRLLSTIKLFICYYKQEYSPKKSLLMLSPATKIIKNISSEKAIIFQTLLR